MLLHIHYLTQPYKVDAIIISVLQVKKQKLRRNK